MGILGKEGSQAARSADFAISKFKHLKPLMFVHGREAIRRNSMMINLSYFKNELVIGIQYFLAFVSGFSGQIIYEPIAFAMYNTMFTQITLLYYQTMDLEHEKDGTDPNKLYFMKDPILYVYGQKDNYFSMIKYIACYFNAIFKSIIITLMTFYCFENPLGVQNDGK